MAAEIVDSHPDPTPTRVVHVAGVEERANIRQVAHFTRRQGDRKIRIGIPQGDGFVAAYISLEDLRDAVDALDEFEADE